MRVSTRRRAFTLIELMVVVVVLTLLIGLLLPAVQSARESARRSQCLNNLRQIGLGVHGYVQEASCLPPNLLGFWDRPNYWNFYSTQARILPFIEQVNLYQALNFSVGAYPDIWNFAYKNFFPESTQARAMNATVRESNVSTFLCPSDGGPFSATGSSYRGNVGVGPNYFTTAEEPDSGNGALVESGIVRVSNIPDGLSHTVLFSERLRGSGGSGFDPVRDAFNLRVLVLTADDLLLGARQAARMDNPLKYVEHGRYWIWMGRERTLYNHAQAPNGPIPDAIYANSLAARGMTTARSNHPGGVNVLMSDGSCRFVQESINQAVWRGLGTRDGGELVD